MPVNTSSEVCPWQYVEPYIFNIKSCINVCNGAILPLYMTFILSNLAVVSSGRNLVLSFEKEENGFDIKNNRIRRARFICIFLVRVLNFVLDENKKSNMDIKRREYPMYVMAIPTGSCLTISVTPSSSSSNPA